ncbi:MAG: tRNA uridine-5-carboxymethylaminomethyl(34) synthesis GTPase MnmE [Candidatus Omnitrophica bacterium]|nr:tRNA uridine-5-carboxymethylaminomethyl(34) synthesis GTPase MnmE [Candidatus Omnitrophota bacterium]MCM8825161.1 tRNA uridine-5-carboxymethylaminomethyl(34) synthesis GTPase MnmE [Candidatus Omnitrophota bacterium]
MEKDTICALSTPYGVSGIGIIRISGPDTLSVINKIFKPGRKRKLEKIWKTHTVRYGYIVEEKGKVIDEVLVTIMKSPLSYTREDMAEIGCHGGLAAIKAVLSLCIRNGVRLAQPGEFTKRAFLNGRIDLTQAESIVEIINSKTEKSLEVSVKQLTGSLSRKIAVLRNQLINIMALVNYEIDFSEDFENISVSNIAEKIDTVINEIKGILGEGQSGRVLTEGVKIAIVGKPNVGKSSLLNLLVEEDRAIVSDIPGTTRDFVEGTICINGIPFTIVDTAGIRNHAVGIEKIGVERAVKWMEKAEMIIVVLDSSSELDFLDCQILSRAKSKPHIIVLNKWDLNDKNEKYFDEIFMGETIVKMSCLTGEGLKQLHAAIIEKLNNGVCEINNPEFFLSIRQQSCLEKTLNILEEIQTLVKKKTSCDITAEMIRFSIVHLDEISGRNISEETLEEIFSRFCVGK